MTRRQIAKRWLITCVALSILWFAVGLFVGVVLTKSQASHANVPTCAEDMRCWNWRTMGNHRRGIVTYDGLFLVVGPQAFDRLNRHYEIDWCTTRKLRGDGRRYGVWC